MCVSTQTTTKSFLEKQTCLNLGKTHSSGTVADGKVDWSSIINGYVVLNDIGSSKGTCETKVYSKHLDKYYVDCPVDGDSCWLVGRRTDGKFGEISEGICIDKECIQPTKCTGYCTGQSREVKKQNKDEYEALKAAAAESINKAKENCLPKTYKCDQGPIGTDCCRENVVDRLLKALVYPVEEGPKCNGGTSGTARTESWGETKIFTVKDALDRAWNQINSYQCTTGCSKHVNAASAVITVELHPDKSKEWHVIVEMPYTITCTSIPPGQKNVVLWEAVANLEMSRYCKKYKDAEEGFWGLKC